MQIAVHPRHGVVWSDGKGIYLAPIHLEGRRVQNSASVKLGEFENVTSVHWSSITSDDSCHLCVVHQQNVTVWRVSGALPKLSFKQVRKINVRPVPQGCLWNPSNDVLCLLSRHQCSFYFRHDLNKGSYAFPALESGSIVCGCWGTDGTKLIICVGTVLLIYRWPDINASLDAFSATAWRIPGLEGNLTCIAPVRKDSIVVAAEVPLESLCKQTDLFKVPDAHGDDDVIRPFKSTSAMDNLMNLQQNSETISDSRSTLTVVHLSDRSRDPVKLSTVPLKGVLTPDILIYEKSSHCVVVGSNSQSQLHIYALLEKHLAYCGNIQLDMNQRPKGLCSLPNHTGNREAALLILVGHRGMEESGFLSASLESEFKLSLKYIMLKTGSHHHSRHSHHSDSTRSTSSGQTKSSSQVRPETVGAGSHHMKTLTDPSIHGGRPERHVSHMVSSSRPEQQVSHMVSSSRPEKQVSHMAFTDDPSLQDGIPERQLPHVVSTYDPIQLALSPVTDSSLELEKLVTKQSVDDIIQKKQLIEDLTSDPSHEEHLQVDKVSFSSHIPSFENSKLAASYQLEPTSQIHVGQANSLQNSVSEILQGEQTLGDATVKAQMLNSCSSVEGKLQTNEGKHLKSASSMKEQLQTEPQKQMSGLSMEEQLQTEPQKQMSGSSMEEQLQTEPQKQMSGSSSMEEQLQTEQGKHLKSSSFVKEQIHTELGKHLMSDALSGRINSTNYSEAKKQEEGCVNTDVTDEHMQGSLSPSLNNLQNSNQVSLISTSTPVLSQTGKITLLAHLHSETKSQITSICLEANKEFAKDVSSSDMLLQTSLRSAQTDTDHSPDFATSVIDKRLQTTLRSSDTDIVDSAGDLFNSLTDKCLQTCLRSSQTNNAHSLGELPSSLIDSALHMSSISSQTDSIYTSEDFSSLLTDRTPQMASISSQTEADSSDHFSSSEYSIKASNISTFSQTELKLPTEEKAQTKSISHETERASQVYLSNRQSKILEAKEHSLPTEPNASYHLNSSQIIPEGPTQCLQEASASSEHLHPAPSGLQSDERVDILDLNHTLKSHELGQTKEDTLSDFGLGSSQYSIDSSWDALEKEARSQKDNIDALHRRLELLSSSVDKTTCVFPTKYQDMSSAEIIEIYCEKPEGTETKKFLLDNGRLQLEPIKLTFDLATVELWLDGIPCVAGANIDGYIPLKFSPLTRLHITGRPANK